MVVVESWFTTWVSVPELVKKLVSPPGTSRSPCPSPAGRAFVLMVALPPLSDAVSGVVEPQVSVMLPVGVPPPGAVALTVKEKVTDWP